MRNVVYVLDLLTLKLNWQEPALFVHIYDGDQYICHIKDGPVYFLHTLFVFSMAKLAAARRGCTKNCRWCEALKDAFIASSVCENSVESFLDLSLATVQIRCFTWYRHSVQTATGCQWCYWAVKIDQISYLESAALMWRETASNSLQIPSGILWTSEETWKRNESLNKGLANLYHFSWF